MSQLLDILERKLKGFRPGGGAWAKALCPYHKEANPSFYINKDSGGFYCQGCKASGSVRTLLIKLGYGYGDLTGLVDRMGLDRPVRKIGTAAGKTRILPDYILGAYDQCPKDLLDEGFNKELLRFHEVGFDFENMRITFPMRDEAGCLIAVSGRTATDEWPRYMFYKFEEQFPEYELKPHDYLWGEDKFMARAESEDPVEQIVLCEGFKASLWTIQCGFFSLALTGSRVFPGQAVKLEKFYTPTVLFFDSDEAGVRGTNMAIRALLPRLPSLKVVNYPIDDEREQPDDFEDKELKEMVNNAVTPMVWRNNLKRKGQEQWIT